MINSKVKKNISLTLRYINLLLVTGITLYPFSLLVLASLKEKKDYLIHPLKITSELSFENYVTVFKETDIIIAFANSLFLVVGAVFLQILFGAMVSYALSKMNLKNSKLYSLLFLIPMVFPLQTIIIPLYLMINGMGMLNNSFVMILLYCGTGLSFVIFVITGFMKAIPNELSEAGIIDGAGHYKIFFQIILPLLKPVISTVIVISGMGIWNDFFVPLIMITEPNKKTLPLIIYQFMGQYQSDWTLIATCIVIIIIPIMILYISLQKYIIKGVMGGAVKG